MQCDKTFMGYINSNSEDFYIESIKAIGYLIG